MKKAKDEVYSHYHSLMCYPFRDGESKTLPFVKRHLKLVFLVFVIKTSAESTFRALGACYLTFLYFFQWSYVEGLET